MAVRDDCSAQELGALVASEPALGLRVLALVNSSAFMLPQRVSDVRQAVSLLGVRGLRNLALSLILSDMAPQGPDGRVLLANSLRRALATQSVASSLGVRQTDIYFTAGLFLDVGLLSAAREELRYAADIARGPAAHRIVRERASGHRPHPVTGAELAASYHLPQSTVDAIAQHHDAEPPQAEEFVVVLPDTDEGGAQVAAERIRRALEEMAVEGPQGTLRVTASFGVATVCGAECEGASASLFERADAALYVAKQAGRNRVVAEAPKDAPPPSNSDPATPRSPYAAHAASA